MAKEYAIDRELNVPKAVGDDQRPGESQQGLPAAPRFEQRLVVRVGVVRRGRDDCHVLGLEP